MGCQNTINSHMQIIGQLVDILQRNIYPAVVTIEAGRIQSITPLSTTTSADAAEPAPILLPDNSPYILPGFIDAHVHIESSLLLPAEFRSEERRVGKESS